MKRRKSYGTRKTTNGLVSIEKKSGKEKKNDNATHKTADESVSI